MLFNNNVKHEADIDGVHYSLETGIMARRADSAVVARAGDTVVLATVTVSDKPSTLDYFPLTVEFVEKYYAGGRISSSRFVKRERFPTDEAVLKRRAIDRSVRPLFPEGYKNEVQLIVTVLSYDDKNDALLLGINAASAALSTSKVPFDGPVAGVRVGKIEGTLMVNPTVSSMETSELDLVFSGYSDLVTMIEVGGNQVPNEEMDKAFDMAASEFDKYVSFQKGFIEKVKKEKMTYEPIVANEEVMKELIANYNDKFVDAMYGTHDKLYDEKMALVKAELVEKFKDKISETDIANCMYKFAKKIMRKGILSEEKRLSGRAMDEIREIDIQVGVLPRVHGSALFTRGVTQALSVATLGSSRLAQTLDSFEGEEIKHYMHHYNGPSYSLGEPGRYSYNPGGREIGHGALAEKALKYVVPSQEEFPYTIRVVSEVLSQSGSSSMASTCGSTLALMEAGVPIKAPVAGIAIGLVTGDTQDEYKLVVDMADKEDFFGDMDFKVAGSVNGVTAIQMDNKLKGVKVSILKEALKVAGVKRLELLSKMSAVIDKPRAELSEFAPKVQSLKIKQDKIGELIGPGGKNIKAIIAESGADVDIKDDGTVFVTAVSKDSLEKALGMIDNIVAEPEVGKVYDGIIDSIKEYGAFVDLGAFSGLVHVSEISDTFVKDITKIIKEGDRVRVLVVGIDEQGRVKLSIKQAKKKDSENGIKPEVEKV
ncbi:MAG: polyribonucleotide nucleotidyltransferase [bacterium]